MVFSQSIEETKHGMRSRDDKRGRIDEQVQPRIEKRSPMQDGSNDPKTDNERGDGSQRVRPTCATCG